MSIERELIKDMKILLECTDMGGLQRNADKLIGRAIELLAQPEQVEHTKTKKEPAIYFAKDETGYIRPVFKNPKETHLWVDVLHGGGE